MCCRRKFRSQTSDNMQRWKSKGVRGPCDNAQSPAEPQCGKWYQRFVKGRKLISLSLQKQGMWAMPSQMLILCLHFRSSPSLWRSIMKRMQLPTLSNQRHASDQPKVSNCHVLLSNHESEDGCWDLAPAVEVRQGTSEAELVVRVGEGMLVSKAVEVRRWTLWSRRDLALAVEVRRGHSDPELAVGVRREHCDRALAVVGEHSDPKLLWVQQGTLRSSACSWQLRSGGGQSDPELAVGCGREHCDLALWRGRLLSWACWWGAARNTAI